jgi:hypothetical protein
MGKSKNITSATALPAAGIVLASLRLAILCWVDMTVNSVFILSKQFIATFQFELY